MTTADRVIDILAQATETDEVRQNMDLALFDEHLLDSLGLVQLVVALEEELGIEIAPAEIERAEFATPRRIVEFVESRAHA
jgi:D-alanine--poly(phosphoribitol) ligase subunit 2